MKNISLVSLVFCLFMFACSDNTEQNTQEESSQEEKTDVVEVESTEVTEGEAKTSQEMGDDGYRRYGVESGIIETELTGFQKGTETIYFDNWGMREAKYSNTVMEIAGMKRETKIFTLIDGEWIYNVDLNTNKGTKIKNPMIESIATQTGEKNFMQLGEEVLKKMGASKTGTAVALGKTCDVWEAQAMNMKLLVWKGIPFKTTVSLGEQMGQNMNSEITVTKFDEEASVPEDKFKLPEDAIFTDMELDLDAAKKMLGGALNQ